MNSSVQADSVRLVTIEYWIPTQEDASMAEQLFQIRQLADEIQLPESGKTSVVLADDENAKVILFAFAAGDGLAEHVALKPAIIQIIQGEADLTVGETAVSGKPGTWIQMAAKTPHSIKATTSMVMLLTLLK
jgi:quercetin dioxygenase-like cupin family protein